MRTVPFLLILALSLSTLPAAPGSQDQDKQAAKDGVVSVTHFNGADIPDFFAWQAFFTRADRKFRLGSGFYKYWLNTTLNLRPLLAKDPAFSQKIAQLLADQGMLVARESERLNNETRLAEKMRKLGEITRDEQRTRYLAYIRQEVQFVQAQHEDLYLLLSAGGDGFWTRIVRYVHQDVKGSIGIARENTPYELDRWEVIVEFKEVGK